LLARSQYRKARPLIRFHFGHPAFLLRICLLPVYCSPLNTFIMPFGEHNTWDFFPRHLYRSEILDPYRAIDDFFQRMELEGYMEDLDEWLDAACSEVPMATQSALDLLCLYEDMEKLIEATHLISQVRREPESAEPASLSAVEERLQALGARYARHYRRSGIWVYFPRHLSPEEFMNPCLVLQRFFEVHSLVEWRDELRMYFEAALSRRPVYEALGGDSNFNLDTRYLKKLVEAAFILFMEKQQRHQPASLTVSEAVD
jgi:hypothetical protein